MFNTPLSQRECKVCSSTLELKVEFEMQVNACLRNGYELHGPPFIENGKLIQVMIKK